MLETKLGFRKCVSDQCLCIKKDEAGVIVICLYIDDTLCTGDNDAIQEFKNEIKNYFAIKEEGDMKEYVGCKVRRTGKRSLIMYQDDLINKIEKNFGEHIHKMQSH